MEGVQFEPTRPERVCQFSSPMLAETASSRDGEECQPVRSLSVIQEVLLKRQAA